MNDTTKEGKGVVVGTTFAPISSEQTEGLKEIALAIIPLLFLISQIDNKSEDLEFGGWRFLFMTFERLLGSEKFQSFMVRYMKEKEGGCN